jgi:methylglyoxal synthase
MFLFLFRFIKYLCAEKEKLKEIMEGNQSRRIDFVDLTKGVCIILVVMAHVGGAFEQLDTNSMLSCFRMPLYFFISELLMGNKFYCTGTTGTLILEALKEKHPDEEWDFTILKSGPLGGDQQMGSRIVDGQIDYLFFFTDPMTLQPHDTDVKALTRLAGVENIVFCCNRSTADHIISSPLFMDPDYERIHPDYSSYTKRFQDKPVVTEAVESVNRRKKKRK